jgi:ubiquinone/menaquinone biosynthesis C-methylase UbiE
MTHAGHDHSHSRWTKMIMPIITLFGRGPSARMAAHIAHITSADRVIDVGCGPGAAGREAARRGAHVVGIDPSTTMLRLARVISRLRNSKNLTWLPGTAEHIPQPDRSATVVWALSSCHHWDDLDRALAEISRVLAPGGRLVILEHPVDDAAATHEPRGLTHAQIEDLLARLAAAGFADAATELRGEGHHQRLAITATAA